MTSLGIYTCTFMISANTTILFPILLMNFNGFSLPLMFRYQNVCISLQDKNRSIVSVPTKEVHSGVSISTPSPSNGTSLVSVFCYGFFCSIFLSLFTCSYLHIFFFFFFFFYIEIF